MRVLAIGAHADDVELGCGGSLVKHADAGDQIHIFVATDGGYTERSGRKRRALEASREASRSAEKLRAVLHQGRFPALALQPTSDLIFEIERIASDVQPDRIYVHWDGDLHLDHAALARATMLATRNVPVVLMYRSNIQQTTRPFSPTFFIDITAYLMKKMELIRLFKSEAVKHAAWESTFTALASGYGIANGFEYAEPFEVYRYRES